MGGLAMARRPSNTPWFHAPSGYWCTTIDGKRLYLDRDLTNARRKLRELRKQQKIGTAAQRDWLQMRFALLADEFLDDIRARRKLRTYLGYQHRLLRALRILGTELRVGEVRKVHLAQVERALVATCNPTTIRDTLAAVQTVFAWAVKNDLIDANPLVGYEKPTARARSRVVEPAEFQALLRHSDPAFRRVLIALRMTGCRPIEIRSLIWECVDLNAGLWIFPNHKTVTQQRQPRPRLVALPEPLMKLCRWLARRPHETNDPVFVNQHGRSFTKDGFCRKFARVRERADIRVKGGENIVLYSARHTFATQATGRVSDTELAELLGHTGTRVLQRYVHLNAAHLREIQRRAQGWSQAQKDA
jgi:integrase